MTFQEMIDRRRQLLAARTLVNNNDPRHIDMTVEIKELTRRIDAEFMMDLKDTSVCEKS